MSNSTLDDFYRGMKMPKYDGKSVFGQMNCLNAGPNTLPMHDENATLQPPQPTLPQAPQSVTIKENVSSPKMIHHS